jgi:stage II sporulation protein D
MPRDRSHIFGWAVVFGVVCLAALPGAMSAPQMPVSRPALVARAIGGREAIVLVASARNGRLLASHDLRDARQLRLLPGSAIKPWTALALLRAGVVTARDRMECRRIVPAFGARFACSHPRIERPFGLRTALAESCNYFFLTASERLPRDIWIDTLAPYGLHPDADSSAENLPLMAIGAAGIHLTPWDLLQAWRKLVWRMGHSNDPDLQLVRQGLIDCVRNGTGHAAQVPGWQVMGKTGTVAEIPDGRTHAWFLAAAPAQNPRILVLVATARGSGEGDAAVIAGRLLRGWPTLSREHGIRDGDSGGSGEKSGNRPAYSDEEPTEAITAVSERETDVRPMPQEKNGILVQLIRPVAGLRLQVESSGTIQFHSGSSVWQAGSAIITAGADDWNAVSGNRRFEWHKAQMTLDATAPMHLSVGARRFTAPGEVILRRSGGRGEVLARLGMEAYVAGVVRGEASGMPYAAQQAMAVVARTWARTHRGRHRRQGFDFCSTTHCQVWRWSPEGSAPARAAISTRGKEVDYHGQPALVFYSANCGGETEAGGPPWTPHGEPYLVAQPDPYCLSHPRRWQFRISRERLAGWLVHEGLFQKQPADLRVQVVRRDRSGRVLWLSISGPPVRMVSADSFRFDVDRKFGWNRIESTLFDVHQADGYVIFSGRGLGHGVGLCQAGAGAMARRGYSWRAILAHYFPGTEIVDRREIHPAPRKQPHPVPRTGPSRGKSPSLLKPVAYHVSPASRMPSPRWRFLVDGPCQIRYAGSRPSGVIEWCPRLLRRAQSLLGRRAKAPIRLVVYSTPAAFIRATGEPGWKAAVTRGDTIRLQPEQWLKRRERLQAVLQHELLLAVMQGWLRPRVDACRQEGLVLALDGEGSRLTPVKVATNVDEARLNERLLGAHSAREFTVALASCYQVARRGLGRLGRRGYVDRVLR